MAALLIGAGVGAGVLLIWVGLWPPRPSLASSLAALHADTTAPRSDTRTTGEGWSARLGRPLAPVLRTWGLPRPGVRRDLTICGRTADTHTAEQAAAAIVGALLPPALAGLAALAGSGWSWPVPVWGALGGAAAGAALPDLVLHDQARRRRRDFTHALSAFLDTTVISLAGGAGTEQALTHAAAAGTGWVHARLRHALDIARLTRRAPWEPLGELGADLDVPALTELAAAMRLAGTEGARVRTSLTARAAGLRLHQLTETESEAAAATERMSLPVVVLMLGFLTVLGYPAMATLLTDL